MSTRLIGVLLALVCATACGGGDTPVGPTGSQVANVAGVWNYAATLTSISGGECVGTLLQSSIGTVDRGTLAITQAGATLTATETLSGTGSACSYSGTTGQNTLSLNMTSCQLGSILAVRCANGASRDVRLITQAITSSVSGSTGNGTRGQTYNVFVAGTQTGVGILTLNGSYTLTR